MLSLLAAAYEDGYAFVKDNNDLYIIRPPYVSRNKRPASLEMLERAVSIHGFSLEDLSFNDWASLIDHLKSKIMEKRKERGHENPDSEQIRRLVQRAPEHIALKYLDNVQQELIPNREWKPAIRLLLSLLKNKCIKGNPALVEKCTDLLDLCQNERDNEENERLQLVENDEITAREFPLIVEYFGYEPFELARHVREQKQVIVIGTN